MVTTMEGGSVKVSGDSITFAVTRESRRDLHLPGTPDGRSVARSQWIGVMFPARGGLLGNVMGPCPGAPRLGKFTSIDIGFGQTCALDTSGQAWCWGANSYGHLGIDDVLPRFVPSPVSGNVRFTHFRGKVR